MSPVPHRGSRPADRPHDRYREPDHGPLDGPWRHRAAQCPGARPERTSDGRGHGDMGEQHGCRGDGGPHRSGDGGGQRNGYDHRDRGRGVVQCIQRPFGARAESMTVTTIVARPCVPASAGVRTGGDVEGLDASARTDGDSLLGDHLQPSLKNGIPGGAQSRAVSEEAP